MQPLEHILLEPEQDALLSLLVETSRRVSRERREKFLVIPTMQDGDLLIHPGFGVNHVKIYFGDVEILAHAGLVHLINGANPQFDVTPLGYKYYQHLKERSDQPIAQVENEIRLYVNSEAFQHKYSKALEKWREAERKLWSSDSQQEITTIGHLCREAIQEFAELLVQSQKLQGGTTDKAQTVARVKAVLSSKKSQLGNSQAAFLDALLVYWGTVSDLIQRQEHGGQKEGESLTWEDARRVVFQSLIVMYEFGRTL